MPAAGIFLIFSSLVCLAGCATQSLPPVTRTGSLSPKADTNGVYALDLKELGLPCNRLKGRIQLRVLEVRDRASKRTSSYAANSMRWVADTSSIWRKEGSPADKTSARDVAVLTAYNQRLGELGCPKYDIATELDYNKSKTWKIR